MAYSCDNIVNTIRAQDAAIQASKRCRDDEVEKMTMIKVSNTTINPRTVVIHFEYASTTSPTMVRPRGFETLANGTKLQVGFILWIILRKYIL